MIPGFDRSSFGGERLCLVGGRVLRPPGGGLSATLSGCFKAEVASSSALGVGPNGLRIVPWGRGAQWRMGHGLEE